MKKKNVIFVDIRDLFKEIIRKIWLVIIFAVAFSIILTGYQYSKDKKASNMENKTVEIAADQLQLSEAEQQSIDDYFYYDSILKTKTDYFENSISMNLKFDDLDSVVLSFTIDNYSDELELRSIKDRLYFYFTRGEMVSQMYAKDSSIEEKYLQELLKYQTGSSTSYSDAFTVIIYGADEKQADNISALLQQTLAEYANQKGFSIQLVSEAKSKMVDYDVLNRQNTIWNDILTTRTRKKEIYDKLTANAMTVVENANNTKSQQEQEAEKEAVKSENKQAEQTPVTINKKMIALGAILGAIIGILVVFLLYLINGKVKTTEDIKAIHGLRSLTKKNKADEEYTVAKIKACTNETSREIIFSAELDSQKEYAKSCMNLLESMGYKTKLVGNIASDAKAVGALDESKLVVLIESVKVSKYADVAEKIEQCRELNVDIIGYAAI